MSEPVKYQCLICKAVKGESSYFKSLHSRLWKVSDGVVLICKDCLQSWFDEMVSFYGSKKAALIVTLHYLDKPYLPSLFETLKQNPDFTLGTYLRQVNGRQYGSARSFEDTLVNGELERTDREVQAELIGQWKAEDVQNKEYALSLLGYDPFDGCNVTPNDLRFLFNSLASYLDDEAISEDNHKIQSVIQIVQAQLQCRKVDELINLELLRSSPNEDKMKELTIMKEKLLSSIVRIAKDNNISSSNSAGAVKGSNTLSAKIKALNKGNFEPIKVNLFDIKTAEAMRQVADISNQSILSQINLDANDYTAMLKEQREMISKLEDDYHRVREDNRLLRCQLAQLDQGSDKGDEAVS